MCVFVCSSHDFFCFAASSALALTLLCCLRAVTICVWFPLPKVGERDERVSELQSRLDEVEAELLAARKESTLKLSEAEAKLALGNAAGSGRFVAAGTLPGAIP